MPPKDDIDERNGIVEVRGGSAGEEAALFAAELFGMYLRYAEQRGWKVETLGIGETDLGGLKEARGVDRPDSVAPAASLSPDGGLSTGPRTPEGRARSRRARLIHGGRSARVRALLREARLQARRARALRVRLTGSSAGHGVHRSKSAFPVAVACGRPSSSTTAPSSMGSRVNDPRARAARPYKYQSNGSVSAGHGLHRLFFESALSSVGARPA